MIGQPVLRVFGFRPLGTGPELDGILRDDVLPELYALPDVLDVFVARHGTGESGERVISTVCASDSPANELDEAGIIARHHSSHAQDLAGRSLEILPLRVAVRLDRDDPACILRVFRGEVFSGELDAYVREAEAGTLSDAQTNGGLVALYLGVADPDRFVTVSAWTGWQAIESATGGNVARPLVTRNMARIAGGYAIHYEIVPNTGRPPTRVLPARPKEKEADLPLLPA